MSFVKIESRVKKFARGTVSVSVDKDRTTLLFYAALLVHLNWKLPCWLNLYWDQGRKLIAVEGPLTTGEFLLTNRGNVKLQGFLRNNRIKPGMYKPEFSRGDRYRFFIPVEVE